MKKLLLLSFACGLFTSSCLHAMQEKIMRVKRARTVGTRAKRYDELIAELKKQVDAGTIVSQQDITAIEELMKRYTYRKGKALIAQAKLIKKGPEKPDVEPDEKPLKLGPITVITPAQGGAMSKQEREAKQLRSIAETKKIELDRAKKEREFGEKWVENLEKIFEERFGKTIAQVIIDLQIKQADAKQTIKKLLLDEMEKRSGIYPENKKIALTIIADKAISAYIEKYLRDKKGQLNYRKKLRKSLPAKGYNIEKIDFLMTVEQSSKPFPPLPTPPIDKSMLTKQGKKIAENFEKRFKELENKDFITEGQRIFDMPKGDLRKVLKRIWENEFKRRRLKINEDEATPSESIKPLATEKLTSDEKLKIGIIKRQLSRENISFEVFRFLSQKTDNEIAQMSQSDIKKTMKEIKKERKKVLKWEKETKKLIEKNKKTTQTLRKMLAEATDPGVKKILFETLEKRGSRPGRPPEKTRPAPVQPKKTTQILRKLRSEATDPGVKKILFEILKKRGSKPGLPPA